MTCVTRVLLAVGLLSTLAGEVSAQQPAQLRPAQSVSGTIGAGDPTLASGARFRLYRFTADAGQPVGFVAGGTDFSPTLVMARDAGGFTEYVRTEEGEAERTVLRAIAPARGEYLLAVLTGAPDEGGAFTLRMLAPRPPAFRPLPPDRHVVGEFDDESAYDEEDDGYFDYYTLTAAAGDVLRISMSSSEIDAVVAIGVLDDGQFEELAYDDDSGDGLDAFLVYTVEEGGEYVIRASSYAAVTGRYTLTVTDAPTDADDTAGPGLRLAGSTSLNRTVSGRLGRGRQTHEDWTFVASPGGEIVIDLRSRDFDPMLELGRIVDGRFLLIDENDDGPDGLNSQLIYTTEVEEELVLRVRQYDDPGGTYTLSIVRRSEAPAQPRTQPVPAAGTYHGRLDHESARLDDDSAFEHWTWQARAGERLVVTLRSTEFDAFLQVGEIVNGQFIPLAVNDDAPGLGTDAQVIMTVRRAGQLVIRANTFGPAQGGAYTLTVEATR